MSGLVGLLVASLISVAIGNVVRGLLRLLSWGLFGIALALLLSSWLTGFPIAEEATNQTTTPAPASSSDRPVAEEGWQDVARDLEPVYSDTLNDPTDTTAVRPTNDSSDSNSANRDVGSAAASRRANSSNARQGAVNSEQSPIPGFW